MTALLVLLCLTVAGAELYLGLAKRRSESEISRLRAAAEQLRASLEAMQARAGAAEAQGAAQGEILADVQHRYEIRLRALEERTDLQELHGEISEVGHLSRALETNVSALREQVRDIVARLGGLERGQELEHQFALSLQSVETVVARVHQRVQEQLDLEVVTTLGGDPPDGGTLLGGLSGDIAALDDTLLLQYANLVEQNGLGVRLQVAELGGVRYYLACPPGRGPVELEWDLMSLLDGLAVGAAGRHESPSPELAALQSLLLTVSELGKGFVQLGPLVIVRSPESLLCGVLSVAESRCFDTDRLLGDTAGVAARLRTLPDSRFYDLTGWSQTH
ncbi:MAG: hypothetical protein JWN00_1965 [Actinomycetia bacterium]|nr:hypothetical protein [Actinomycetes bacterium]